LSLVNSSIVTLSVPSSCFAFFQFSFAVFTVCYGRVNGSPAAFFALISGFQSSLC